MGIRRPRVRNQTELQSGLCERGLSSSSHIPGKLMNVESHYTLLTGSRKLCVCLVMQSFHFLMHFLHYLVVSLTLLQFIYQGASIIVFIWMYSPNPPNWSPISIYHPPPVLLLPDEFYPLLHFVILSLCALHANQVRCHAHAHFNTSTYRV